MKWKGRHIVTWSGFYLLLLAILTATAPFLTFYGPLEVNLDAVLEPPSASHLLGTDELGRDIWSRLLYGGRVSLTVGFAAMLVSLFIGVSYGALSGFIGGMVDRFLMRVVDTLLSLPSIIVIIGLQVFFPKSMLTIMLLIGLTSWMPIARLIRAEVLSLKGEIFVQASAVVGASPHHLLLRHVLPQTMPTIAVMAIGGVSHAILTESTLSFLGIGIPPHEASWGNMLTGVQTYILSGGWWVALFPGICITLTVLAVTFIGDRMQDRFALPQLKGGESI
ncbi:peptide/nickel transport system permease protein [Sporosarcina luteola]|nr:peptide/nickel transport system permease protein [Sporosarcina luteola]